MKCLGLGLRAELPRITECRFMFASQQPLLPQTPYRCSRLNPQAARGNCLPKMPTRPPALLTPSADPQMLADALPQLPLLCKLDLSHNSLTGYGLETLAGALLARNRNAVGAAAENKLHMQVRAPSQGVGRPRLSSNSAPGRGRAPPLPLSGAVNSRTQIICLMRVPLGNPRPSDSFEVSAFGGPLTG